MYIVILSSLKFWALSLNQRSWHARNTNDHFIGIGKHFVRYSNLGTILVFDYISAVSQIQASFPFKYTAFPAQVFPIFVDLKINWSCSSQLADTDHNYLSLYISLPPIYVSLHLCFNPWKTSVANFISFLPAPKMDQVYLTCFNVCSL